MEREKSDQQLQLLLEKYLKGACTQQEQQVVEQWYNSFESHLAGEKEPVLPELATLYSGIVQQLKEEQVWQEAPVVQQPRIRRMWWRAAAAVLVLIVTGSLGFLLLRPAQLLEVSTPAAAHSKIMLPDGTQVWLNVSSRLQYSAKMKTGHREVYLQGEGFFEVAKNEQHPFIIHTSDISVEVLGTSFNLKAYAGDQTLETTLLKGKVAVSLNSSPEKRVLLAPDEKLTLTRKTATGSSTDGQQDWGDFLAEVESMKQQAEQETTWRENRLEFKNKPFNELARIMERWYGKTIIIQDTTLNNNRFNGTFRREDITQALKALQLTADFKYKIRRDTVFIHN
jgi:transmembrane sensor